MTFVEPVSRLTPAVTVVLVVVAVVVVALGLGAEVVGTAPQDDPDGQSRTVTAAALPDAAVGGAAGATSRAREVLREWDRRREAAWARADESVLTTLYLPRAVAGQRDVRLLHRWTARGARVTRLQPQVLALRVVREAPRRLVVQVTDRLGIVKASVVGEPVALPRDRPTTRRIDLRRGPRVTSRWRVAAVRDLGATETLGE